MRVLFCWLGWSDIERSQSDKDGAISSAVAAIPFDEVVILNDYPAKDSKPFFSWLKRRTKTKILEELGKLNNPMEFSAVYKETVRVIDKTLSRLKETPEMTFHLSPGTSAMATIWVILAKTKYPAGLIRSSPEEGVTAADIPFEIAADFIPELYRRGDDELERLTAGLPPESAAFTDIVHRSAAMQKTIALARRFAARNVTVLIEGESGTGKDLLARAIHDGSMRRNKPMQVVNCGAIPATLVEETLFGHKKGAYTGAATDKKGVFEEADGSTIFLDEIGELPLDAQVKLLRVLQNRVVQRVGDSKERPIDVRIIAATNRTLAAEVQEGAFREDLFYRLAEVVVRLPPLRDRREDIEVLVPSLLETINQRFSQDEVGYEPKSLTAGARTLLKRHDWPGNIRELQSVLTRAAITATSAKIGKEELQDALFQLGPRPNSGAILNRPLDVDINAVINEVKRHYLERALEESRGNMTRAAELVGLKSYQVFGKWLEKARAGE